MSRAGFSRAGFLWSGRLRALATGRRAGAARLASFFLARRSVRKSGPQVSRPPHKQLPDQKSGKGKVDYIFARGARLERDAASRRAVLLSHAPCGETGEWPSDHGVEAATAVR